MKTYFLISAVCLLPAMSFAQQASQPGKSEPGVGLTVYNDDFAVVKDRRVIEIDSNSAILKFTDVATSIDPTSVSFECLSSPGALTILEQNYQYDLVNTESLLKRYIDKDIIITVKGSGSDPVRFIKGRLLSSHDQNVIIRKEDRSIDMLRQGSIDVVSLSSSQEELITKPTLVWLTSTSVKGPQLCQVTYTTTNIQWKADYTAILDPNESSLDMSGWVTIDNRSGTSYTDAIIKLVAGDVRRIKPPQPMYDMAYGARRQLKTEAAQSFEEKPFMEYHLYTLGRKSTVGNNEIKQIELMEPARGVPIKKLFVYDYQEKADKVQVKFEFENTKENHLGMALPKGKIRVFKRDPADNMLEFVGEDEIDHTARKEKLSLYIGDAFDIVPEHTVIDSKVDRHSRTDTHKIELRNRKDTPVTVRVDEKFPQWVNWEITQSTHKSEKHDARTARFTVQVPADTSVTLQYTALQTWPW